MLLGCHSSVEKKGSEETTGSTSKKTLEIGIVFESGGRKDPPFNLSIFQGAEKAAKEFGAQVLYMDNPGPTDLESNIETLAEGGKDLVIVVGRAMKSPLERVASKFPNVRFAYVDGIAENKNVRSITFKEQEGCFLAGYLAGLMTRSNRVGFVGGMEIPHIKAFQVSYEAGARTANPHLKVLPAKYVGSWENIDAAKVAAKLLYQEGADIIFHGAGKAGLGVLKAAKETNKYAIGVDSDQDSIEPGHVLTSMIKCVDHAVYSTIKDLSEGKFEPGHKIYDLRAGGVKLSPMQYTKSTIGPDNIKKVEQVQQMILDGKITPPSNKEQLDQYLKSKGDILSSLH
jgi:basic membrane protein A